MKISEGDATSTVLSRFTYEGLGLLEGSPRCIFFLVRSYASFFAACFSTLDLLAQCSFHRLTRYK